MPLIRVTCALLLCLAAPGGAHAQVAPPAWAARVDAFFADAMQPDGPGCAVGIYRAGDVLYTRGYGLADVERHVPITPRTIFDIGSTSKQFTAAAIALLVQDGRLGLDDDVRRHVPELPSYGHTVTIRHLLHHTSGLRDYIGLLTMAGFSTDDVTDDEDALAILMRQKALNFTPGTEQLYSNSGYFLASLIVQRVAGQPLREFARARLFTPLGMHRSFVLHRTDDIVVDRAQAYGRRDEGTLRLDLSRWNQTGDGAVWTTVEELARWDGNFYSGTVGGAALLQALQTPGTLDDGRALPTAYGLGLNLGTYRGAATVRHGGSWSGFRSDLLRFPALRTSVAVLCNFAEARPGTFAERVADIVLERELSGVPVPAPPDRGSPRATPTSPTATETAAGVEASDLSALAGRYYSAELDASYTLELRDGVLYSRRRGSTRPLTATGKDTFRIGSSTITVTRDAAGAVTGYTLDLGRVRGVRFDRVR